MSSRLQNLYEALPLPVQNAMVTARGYLNNYSRYGATYWRYRDWLRRFDSLDLGDQLAFQAKAYRDFLQWAYGRSPYYERVLTGLSGEPLSFEIGDSEHVPVLDKEVLRSNVAELQVPGLGRTVQFHTGGTTGKSLTVPSTFEDLKWRMAMLDHFKSRHGFEHRKMRRASFTGKPISAKPGETVHWRYNHACRQMLYSATRVSPASVADFVNSLNDFAPQSIDGFPTALEDVARHILETGTELTFKPVAIFPTSEVLTESTRQLLQDVFRAPVYDQYASSEGAPFITECVNQVKHAELSSGVFETGDNGHALVTSFSTHAAPLIRYEVGDVIVFADEREVCSCGHPGPIVKEISGRTQDFLYNDQGGRINAGSVANLFKNVPNAVVAAQIAQGQIGAIRIRMVVDRSVYEQNHERLIQQEVVAALGDGTRVYFEYVEDIPREPNGKRRFIKNSVQSR